MGGADELDESVSEGLRLCVCVWCRGSRGENMHQYIRE